jgi:histidine phosphotransferase ChpT
MQTRASGFSGWRLGRRAAVSRGGRVQFDWQPQNDLPRQEVKLAFLLLQCFETAMPRGGHVSVSVVGGQWAITGEAEQLTIRPERWEVLSVATSDIDLDAADVQFALAPIAADAIGRRLTLESSPKVARVRF